MNSFESFIYIITSKGNVPKAYGLYHLICIALAVIICVLLCKFYKNTTDKNVRKILFICWIIMLIFEVYKQIAFTFQRNENDPYWDYQWYMFPYQLCSTPLYTLPLIVFLKDSRVRDAFIAFTSTYALFGGLVVFVYPNDVFTTTIGINIQTMVHHGIQIISGIFLLVYNRKKLNISFLIKGTYVFVFAFILAIVLNESVYFIFKNNNITPEVFNMFYISRHYGCHLPILNTIYLNTSYVFFLLVYLFGFTLISFIIILITRLVLKLTKEKENYVTK